ncbi:hypothetical protein OEZ85_000204 [Tetradesmus obliquus]|uniref:Lycopene epsilon cyclase n=1 Tax=Tetradesmus obliquus TaxID=3088 RepID=A0ABY8US28_TETOB|nr:hypothetical protein OEZ85_000204 [Tetradesmus obliquus]
MLLNPTKISARHLNGTNARKAFRPATPSKCGSRRISSAKAVAEPAVAPAAAPAAEVASLDYNQLVREGHYEAPLVQEQASKQDSKQPAIASLLPALAPGSSVDALVVGCGPAGIYLAAQLAEKGLKVGLVGPDGPFVNNYGVWVDEFKALGMGGTLEREFSETFCYFQEKKEVGSSGEALGMGGTLEREFSETFCYFQEKKEVGSSGEALGMGGTLEREFSETFCYFQEKKEVGSSGEALGMGGTLEREFSETFCYFQEKKEVGSSGEALGMGGTLEREFSQTFCYFQENKETRVGRAYGRVSRRLLREHLLKLAAAAGVQYMAAAVEDIQVAGDGATATVTCSGGAALSSRLVTLASGQAAGRFLRYEDGAPTVAAQTAYGIEAEVQGYHEAYDSSSMLFMDYRRHHSGLWDGAARHLEPGLHPNAGEGLWGSSEEVPSFLYAMPLGGNRVFLEETCLVAKPALPFAVLKRRLERRLAAMNVKVNKVHEEEWSYIPVGGPLPVGDQPCTAFGAAANLVHPATGFSVSRSLRQAPEFAAAAAAALAAGGSVQQVSSAVWQQLWSKERRQQAAFHVFGMELLTQLDLAATNDFFKTFFALPNYYWRGFLGSNLSSVQLLVFAFLTFLYAPVGIKAKLVSHLITDPAGKYLIDRYLAQDDSSSTTITSSSSSSISSQSAAAPSSSSNAEGNGVSASSNGSSAPEQEAVLPAAVAADASSSR